MGPSHTKWRVVTSGNFNLIWCNTRVKTPRTLLLAISWTCSGYWVTEAHIFISAGYQATVALRKWKSGPTSKRDPRPRLASAHYTDLKPLVNTHIQLLVQTKWDVAVHGRDLYLVKPTLGQPKKFQHLTRADRLWSPDFELAIPRPPSPISYPEDHRLVVTTVVKHWALTICSWSVQYYRNVVTNTTQLTHWIPSLRQFLRLA